MRILLVNDYGTATGGAEVLFLLLRRLLRERGHAVRLFSSSARPLGAPCEADDTCFGTTTTARTTLQAANPWAAARIGDVLRDFRPDVVHVGVFLTQLSPSILPRLRDIPALFHVHWYRAVCPLGTKRLPNARDCNEPWGTACLRNGCLTLRAWLPMMAQRQLWHRYRDVFDRTIACGDAVRRRLEEAGFPNIEVVPNCVAPRQQRPALQDPPTAAFSGRLVAEKGVDVLVDAFSQVVRELPGARLLLIGEGPERQRIERRIAALNLAGSVELTGWLTGEALEARLRSAWVQVVPSLWEEPFGLAAAEAMMRGTAVVASARGGPTDLIQDGSSGLLVPPGDSAGLASALLALLRDASTAERMGRAARRFALDHLSEHSFVDRVVEIYNEMLLRCCPTS